MKANTLRDLYIMQLKDLYSAEKQLTKALPKLVKGASSQELKDALQAHLSETEVHVARLDKIFEALGAKPGGHKCKGMEGLIEEGAEVLQMEGQPELLDAAIIAAAQRVEHYEIAGYGCARAFAELLGDTDGVEYLQETLDEESAADEKLTEVAQSSIHPQISEVEAN